MVVIVVGILVALGMVLGWLLLEDVLETRRKRLPPANPIAVLDDRFARGEIDEADWASRRAALTYGPPLELR